MSEKREGTVSEKPVWVKDGRVLFGSNLAAAQPPEPHDYILIEMACVAQRDDWEQLTLVEQGWADALRALHPDERIYTFWKYFRNAFARDAGLRIDHLLLSPSIAGRLVAAEVDRDVRGREKASDHTRPSGSNLRMQKSGSQRRARADRDGCLLDDRCRQF